MHSKSVLSFLDVAKDLSYPTPESAYVARLRGLFPVRVRKIGSKLVCFNVDLEKYLDDGESQAHLSVSAIKRKSTTVGRPKKSETLEARKRGISVPELRSAGNVVETIDTSIVKRKRGRPTNAERAGRVAVVEGAGGAL
ncbi:MAG: hypothetical protein Q8L80_00880 [Gallionella sp.]|nr:hypothetical protein [Gallionella sp.]